MHALQQLQERLHHWIWNPLPPDAGWWHRQLVDVARIAVSVGRDVQSGALGMRAMGLVFTTLLSLVPLIAVSFSVLKGFGVHNQVEPALLQFLAPLGERSHEITERIVGFVDNIKVGVLGTVGVALLLYTAISLVQKIEEAFNFTWNVDRRRTLARRFSDYLSVLVIGPLLVFLAIGITATFTSTAAMRTLLEIEAFGHLLRLVTGFMPYLLVIAAFTFIYVLIPNTRVKLRHALYGGVVAGVLWETVGRLFATFVATSTNYTAIYSGFAILLLFMIWLYLSWLILLLGSSIAFYRQYPEYLQAGGRAGVRLSHVQEERLALASIIAVTRAWYANEAPPDRDRLARLLGMPVHPVDRVLHALQAKGLLTPCGSETTGFLPGRPPEQMTVKQVLDAVRGHGRHDGLPAGEDDGTAELMQRMDGALAREFANVTIADLASGAELSALADEG